MSDEDKAKLKEYRKVYYKKCKEKRAFSKNLLRMCRKNMKIIMVNNVSKINLIP